MLKITLAAGIVSLGALGLPAATSRRPRRATSPCPKYEVEKTQSGSVTVPKYEVTPPDVKVGSTEKTVTVPKVTTEEKKIEVPTVSVTPAPDKK